MNTQFPRIVRLGLVPLIIVGLVAVAYSNSLHCSWQFDDFRSILEFDYANATLRSIFLFSPQRSLVFLTFWLNYLVAGYSLPAWHLVNISIHALNCLLLYALAASIFRRAVHPSSSTLIARYAWLGAGFVAAVFAVHPLQTQAVTYIVQRLELLGTLWAFSAIYAAIRAFDTPSPRARHAWAAAATLALAAGALSKEIIVAAPVLIALYFILIHIRSARALWRALLWSSVLAIVLVATILVLFRALTLYPVPRISLAPFASLWQDHSPATYYPLQPRVLLLFLRLCSLPYNLRAEYELDPSSGWWDPRTLGALLVHALLLGGSAILSRRRPLLLFGVLWFYTFLLPSTIMPNGIFEHRAYGALAGILLATVGLFLHELVRLPATLRRIASTIAIALATCLIVCFTFLTFARNTVWSTELSLWLDTVQKSPNSWRANANAGRALMDAGDLNEAKYYLEKAFALKSNVYLVASNLGVLYFNLHDYQRSAQLFSYALTLKPNHPLLLYYLGAATVRCGDFHTGTNLLHRSALPAAWTALGDLFYERGDYTNALAFYQRTLDQRPSDLDAVAGKLRALIALGATNVPQNIAPPPTPRHDAR